MPTRSVYQKKEKKTLKRPVRSLKFGRQEKEECWQWWSLVPGKVANDDHGHDD